MEKYNLLSGYVLSKENITEIEERVPRATITWVGDTTEIKEILRIKGEFNYILECPRPIELSTKQKLEELLKIKIN